MTILLNFLTLILFLGISGNYDALKLNWLEAKEACESLNNGEGGYDIWATILPPLPSPGLLLCQI